MFSLRFVFAILLIGATNAAPSNPIGSLLGGLGSAVNNAVGTAVGIGSNAVSTAVNGISGVGTAANNAVQNANGAIQNILSSLGTRTASLAYKLHDLKNMIIWLQAHNQPWPFNPCSVMGTAIYDLDANYLDYYPIIKAFRNEIDATLDTSYCNFNSNVLSQFSVEIDAAIDKIDPQVLVTGAALVPLATAVNSAAGGVNSLHSCWMTLADNVITNTSG